MTLISKEGASTSPAVGDSSKLEATNGSSAIPQADASDAPAPPSYAETLASQNAAGSSTSAATSSEPLPPPSNFYSHHSPNGEVKGIWAVDTSMDIPSAFLSQQSSSSFWKPKKEPFNLDLKTQYGAINAAVALVSGQNTKAKLNLHTQGGKVVFKMLFRANEQPFKLNARSEYGSITIYLPRSFNGPVKHKTNWGAIKFSPGMQPHVHQFSEGVAYVGDWRVRGFSDYKTWDGDEIDTQTQCGDVCFAWIDEVETFPGPTIGKNVGDFIGTIVQNALGWFQKK
ncbi:hypothetical protein FRB91_005854 [Serendipita sp. 411]|nr:hypothetical protein FRC15_008515 [Serendipita sp. 397]KAG8852850.1 hypothetical protein FRB91_005854 [Serendipita sp. 411]